MPKKNEKIKGTQVTFDNQYVQQRIEKANQLREMGIDPYANNSHRNTTIEKYHNVNSDLAHQEEKRDEKYVIHYQSNKNKKK
jgi:lysyl-tRNA synthetase class II